MKIKVNILQRGDWEPPLHFEQDDRKVHEHTLHCYFLQLPIYQQNPNQWVQNILPANQRFFHCKSPNRKSWGIEKKIRWIIKM